MIITWMTKIHEVISEKTEYKTDILVKKTNIIYVYYPEHEVNYWINRLKRLEKIQMQINTTSYKNVINILEIINSAYYVPFTKIYKEFTNALEEARSVSLWLQPLLSYIMQINSVDFADIEKLLVQIVHAVHLLWCNCKYYSSTKRITVLLQCICNVLVNRASDDLDMSIKYNIDVDEILKKIKTTLHILISFK